MARDDDVVVLDLTVGASEDLEGWRWVEQFRVDNGVSAVIEDPVLVANLAVALLTRADASRGGPG